LQLSILPILDELYKITIFNLICLFDGLKSFLFNMRAGCMPEQKFFCSVVTASGFWRVEDLKRRSKIVALLHHVATVLKQECDIF